MSNVPYILGHSDAELRRLMLQSRQSRRLRAEVTALEGVQLLPALIGAWTRTPLRPLDLV